MKAKLVIEGKEFPIEINDPEMQKLLEQPQKTGYERVHHGEKFYSLDPYGGACECTEDEIEYRDQVYRCGNYYSSKMVALNNSHADKLMRQLRRFSMEHGGNKIDWNNDKQDKYYIRYIYDGNILDICHTQLDRNAFAIYFESYNAAALAIGYFHDELIWYFTEYKDSL
jgi:hypothetical protein